MTKTVYFHIGNFKTGTSSIQKNCHKNKSKLDFIYPEACRPSKNRTNHGCLSLSLLKEFGIKPPGWFKDNVTIKEESLKIINEIRLSDKDKVLISSEEFFRVCTFNKGTDILEKLREEFKDFQVKIIMYIREPLSFFQSWFNQVNKGKFGTYNYLTYFSRVQESFLSQYPVYNAFSQCFGKENVIVRPYILKGSAHLNDFFSSIDSSYRVKKRQRINYNVRMDEQKLEIIRITKFNGSLKDSVSTLDTSFAQISNKIDRINCNFQKLCEEANLKMISKLSLSQLVMDYLVRSEQIMDFMKHDIVFLRDEAISIEKENPELAYKVMCFCRRIRPEEKLILDKVLENELSLYKRLILNFPRSLKTIFRRKKD
jgi:hypothetical protein